MKVLFVLGDHEPLPFANGICVESIQEELLNLGIQSDVICNFYEEKIIPYKNCGVIYTINNSMYGRNGLSRFQKLFCKIRHSFCWPLNSTEQTRKLRNKIVQVLNGENYDAVICVIKPHDGAYAFSTIKGNYKVPFYVYELDSITDSFVNNSFDKKIFMGRAKRIERKIYDTADKIIHLECHRSHYNTKKYDVYRNKFVYTDIPLLINRSSFDKPIENTIIYSGFLLRNLREPDYFISLFNKMDNNTLNLKFFSNGSCEDAISKHAKMNPCIKQCGFIPVAELEKEMEHSAYFLNISSNKNEGVAPIPSKLFMYFSYGRPVIHILGDGIDSSVPYLEKYGLSLIINPNDNIDENVRKLESFMKDSLNKKVDFTSIEEQMIENTPKYTAQLIINLINKHSEIYL